MKRFILSLLLLLVALVPASATELNPGAPVSVDPELRVGTFDNGMKYYIRRNTFPENQADFYLVFKVGALDEDDSQIGLAHFLEHMAFNGTKNLPEKTMINYLERVGVKFGANLNASTGQEQTIYNMASVPTTREGIVDTALLVLHDWAHFITLDPKEIDNERPVIIEELRTGQNASRRLSEKSFPILFNGSKYAQRNVIGEVWHLESFPHKALVDFYDKWYHAANEAVIVVGDIDPEAVEQKLRALMADIPGREGGVVREPVLIPDNEKPLIFVGTDPEQTTTNVTILIKRQPMPWEMRDKVIGEMFGLVNNAISGMISNRLYEIGQQPDAPFLGAGGYSGGFVETSDAIHVGGTVREGEQIRTLEALYSEIERIKRYGFTQGELDRVLSEMTAAEENRYANRNQRRSSEYVSKYVSNFTFNTPIPGPVAEWQLDSTLMANIDLGFINMAVQQMFTDENHVVLLKMPQKDGLTPPTEAEVAEVIAAVRAADIAAYNDDSDGKVLFDKAVKAGKVKKKSAPEARFGSTEWTLSNGMKVVYKQTDLRDDQIMMSIEADGGLSTLSDSEVASARLLSGVVSNSGLAGLTDVDLDKVMAGSTASLSPYVGNYSSGFNGKSNKRDFETLLQLANLRFTEPRFAEQDFDVYMGKNRSYLQNASSNPSFISRDSLFRTLYGNNIRRNMFDLEMLDLVNFAQMSPIYQKLYGNPADFTVTIVGSIDPKTMEPLVAKYLGSLKTKKSTAAWKNDGVRYAQGEVINDFSTKMETPKTSIYYHYSGPYDYNPKNAMIMSFLSQILRMRYTESIREEKGGTYGVSVQGGVDLKPNQEYSMFVVFDTNEQMAAELQQDVVAEIQKIADEGPREDDMNKVKEYMIKTHQANLKENGSWMEYIKTWYSEGIDSLDGYTDIVTNMSPADIQALAAKVLADNNLTKVIMHPAE